MSDWANRQADAEAAAKRLKKLLRLSIGPRDDDEPWEPPLAEAKEAQRRLQNLWSAAAKGAP